MAQQTVDPKVGELGPGNGESTALSGQDKQLPVAVKKTPLRDLQSENNIAPQRGAGNPPVLKEAVITEAAKLSGTKRLASESPMSPHQQSSSGNGTNSHLVYVRRKSEAEGGRNANNEAIGDNTSSPQLRQVHQEDGVQPKSLTKGPRMKCIPSYAPIPTPSLMTVTTGKPSVPFSLENLNKKIVLEEPQTQPVPSASTSSVQARVKKQNWEDRYLQLQMFLKKLDQSSMEDHLRMLRSLSAVELSRHAVELEKWAIQLSLEQGKELQRVKALNVLGKMVRTSNGPSLQQQMPQV